MKGNGEVSISGGDLFPGSRDESRWSGADDPLGSAPDACNDLGNEALRIRLSLLKATDLDSVAKTLASSLASLVPHDIGSIEVWQGLKEDEDDECSEETCLFRKEYIPGREDQVEELLRTGSSDGPKNSGADLPSMVRVRTGTGTLIPLFVRSTLMVPLEWSGERLGVLTLLSERQRIIPNINQEELLALWEDLGYSISRILSTLDLRMDLEKSMRLDMAFPGPRIIWHGDGAGWGVDLNSEAESLFPTDEAMKTLAEGPNLPMTESDRKRANRIWNEVLEGGAGQTTDLSIIRPDGSSAQMLCTFAPLTIDDRRKGISMTCVAMGVMDNMVRDILAANRSYRLALSILSHDLKNPLSAINGYAGIIKETAHSLEAERASEYAQTILRIASRMSQTIETTRTLIQIQEGKVRKDYRRMDISPMLRTCLEQLDLSGRSISLNLKDGDFQITCHPLIQQTFLNLLDNAIKYSPPGSRISVGISADLEGVTVSVADEGEGIPRENREIIFERFSRATKIESIKGTGLGLAISRGIVELHNGRIWVEENSPKGSVFKVFLPWNPL